jgi:GrpB-like predicted nucleotidyltransferase (UPF0157 family)
LTDTVELRPYDPDWPAAFERERTLIAPILGANAVAIEHMGSTSIRGLSAKPIVDVIVLVQDLELARDVVPALEETGYSYWADNPDKTKLFLVRGLPPAPHRTHHLHIYSDVDEVERHLVFRDQLRADPRVRDAYLALKTELAERFRNDREAYTAHKAGFINDVVSAARSRR